MEILRLSEKEFDNLQLYKLSSEIWHMESSIYSDPNNPKRVFKVYNAYYDKKWMKAKIKAIKNLIRFTDEHDIPEILKPDGILVVNDSFRGEILPIIPGSNANCYFNSKNTPIKVKIEILKQIGTILDKIYKADPSAAFADVHGDNFLVSGLSSDFSNDISHLKTTGIDTDSMKIYDSPGITNFYLDGNGNIYDLNKYHVNSAGITLTDSNTDIYCFVMMILWVISNNEFIYTITIDEYNRYLDYLDKIGFNTKLLEALASVYQDNISNINPLPYLDNINVEENTSFKFFKRNNR